jgi:hypothetical protein
MNLDRSAIDAGRRRLRDARDASTGSNDASYQKAA